MIVPIAVAAGLVIVGDRATTPGELSTAIAFASPKSSTFTVPSSRTLMFAGLRSRLDDALRVRGFERLGNLPRDGQCVLERNRTTLDAIGERRSFDYLEHERRSNDQMIRTRRWPRCWGG
jgi:hypothetical protein